MEANQVHPLLGPKIHTLPRSSLPSKLQIMNFIRFKMDSKRRHGLSNKEKSGIYREVAKELILIWREAYIVCSIEDWVTEKIRTKIIPLLLDVRSNTKFYLTSEEKKDAKLSELNKLFDIARCPCFR